jgi:hypothetical protein
MTPVCTITLACVLLTSLLAPATTENDKAGPPLFDEVTRDVGLEGVESSRVAFADLNGDGRPDAIIGQTRVFLNERGRRFVRSGLDRVLAPDGVREPNVVQVGDVNNDSRPDLYLGRYTDLSNEKFQDDGLRGEIWLGDGKGGFARKQDSGVGKEAETTISACFLDFDRDGNLDLFVGNAYTAYGKSYEAFPDRLYRGRGDGTFEDVTERAGLLGILEPGHRDSRKPTYGVTHADWNNDGLQDLLVATYGRQWNRLWRNNGDGTFTDVAEQTGFDGDEDRSGKYPAAVEREDERPFRANGNTFDCAVADFDNDGDVDCFLAEITHWWAGSSSDLSMLLINQGKEGGYAFRRDPNRTIRHHTTERWNQGDLYAGWLDVDNDGYLDLLIASSDYPDEQILHLYHQRPDGGFEEWTDRLGFRWINASQLSLADFDRDGATDILLGTNNMRLTEEQRKEHDLSVGLFRNTAAARLGNRFLNVRLMGQAVGARVTVVTGKHRQMRGVYGGLGHAGHRDDTDCRFGVGKAETADLVEVRWPDAEGTVQRFTNVKTNRFYRLKKDGQLTPVAP